MQQLPILTQVTRVSAVPAKALLTAAVIEMVLASGREGAEGTVVPKLKLSSRDVAAVVRGFDNVEIVAQALASQSRAHQDCGDRDDEDVGELHFEMFERKKRSG
ncbi:hypothetical protein B0H66DRAFT_556318 [Apodospora peruviana]|uniref:Uncharacterized protein n=1 Tax=Apodospora peruviana TaxID=516989 RepID=A0AAE0I4N5_9PEZI|nr:hypothetical protein B0H66DRAFT_556318 [Apodospora peruviana]